MKKITTNQLAGFDSLKIDKEFENHCFEHVSNMNIFYSGMKKKILPLLTALFLIMILPFQGLSQSPSNEALWSENGWSLKKVVSNTTIASGVNFSYTIIFSAPAGVPSISIQDIVPAGLQVVSVTAAGPVCTVTPTTNIAGNTVSYNLTGLPGTCAPSGSLTIVVKFPEGITCNGVTARNRAEIMVNGKWEATPYVSTTATAVIPWKVTKYIIAKASVNPNGGNCGYIMAPGDTITYRLAVLKDNPYFGNVTGQQNMSNAVVTDVLPAGAQFISSSNPTCVSPVGSTITWNVNCSPVTVPAQLLDAANPWAYYWVDIKVKYPVGSFPVNTQILNQATLTGVSCNQPYSHISNQTCITVTPANPSGQFGKYLQLTNRVPGCAGLYYIAFCNNGNVPLTAFNINDAIPAGISVNSVQIYGANPTTTMNLVVNGSPYATGITNSYSSGALTGPPVTSLQFQMTGSLPVGGCIYMYVNFTINPNPVGTIVTNCATFNGLANGLTLPQSCVQFTVAAGAPVPCLLKDICSPQPSYNPGDIVRFRVRVQNIGSATMTGSNIQDILNSNFTYLGNECYFTSTTYNPGCSVGSTPPSGTTAWTGVTPSHAGNNLQWSIPSIASNCQLFYSSYCGYYGTYGIPYYYIEFDAKVSNMALPGVTPNLFQISGGNLSGTTTSNTVNVLVAASFGQEVTKFLSTDNGANFAGSGTTAPGSTVKYRMNYKNTSNVPVTNVRLIDLLPKDAAPSDFLIFNRLINRGSQFSVNYTGNHATSLFPAAIAPTSVKQWAPGINICLPPYVTGGGCNATTWGATPTSNLQVNYGSYSLAPTVNLREDFDVTIPLTAQTNQQACNDFAAIASANFLLNGSPQTVALTPLAAPPVCVNVIKPVLCCDSVKIQQVGGINGATGGCCARITTTCKVDSINVDIFGGTIGNVSWNCGPLPVGYSGTTNFTFPANGCVLDMTTCFNIPQAGVPIITYTIHFSSGEKCTRIMDLICNATPPNCCDSIRTRIVQNPTVPNSCCAEISSKCVVDSIKVTVLNGTLSSANWNCGPIPAGYIGQSTYTFNANSCAADLITCVNAKQTGTVTINYVVYLPGGIKCEKSVQLDCKVPTCCDLTKVERVLNSDGTASCCAKLTTPCDVKSVNVAVTNGTIASAAWNCTTPIPTGYVGLSNFTFAPGCAVAMTNCFDAIQSGIVTVTYTINFSNGETCKKIIELNCSVPPAHCCDSIEVRQVQNPVQNSCCGEIISTCKVDSIKVSVLNGTLSSATWNCGAIPAGYVGQSTYTFNANGCAANLITCVNAKQTGVVTINYVVYMSNGEKCERSLKFDCQAPTCCEKTKVENILNSDGTASCCVKLTTECEVKSVNVAVTNGTIASTTWNCTTPVPAGSVGSSNYTFAPGCAVTMKNCFDAKQSGVVTVTYTINFANGETCKKTIDLKCSVPVNCCDSILVQAVQNPVQNSCCAEIISKCEVDSIKVSVLNGTLSSATWNCGTIPAGYVGQSTYTFNANGCAANLITCVNPKVSGVVTINYVVYLSNGEKCEKSFKIDCIATANCCDKTKIEQVLNSDGTTSCCLKLTTECEVKSVKVDVINGTIASAAWNCATPIPSGYVGQSSYTFAPGCAVIMTNCFDAIQTGIVIVNYTITYSNGEVCKKVMDLDCIVKPPVHCCDSIQVRQVAGTTGAIGCCYEIKSKCNVDSIKVTVLNGTLSSATWNCGPIPAGYVGQSSYTFIANNCAADLITCVNAKQTGTVTINYVVYMSNKEKCEKSVKFDCKAPATCCDKTRVEKVQNADGTYDCCLKLTTECEVKSVKVDVLNGTISSALWNCGPVPPGYAGQSSYTFAANGCVVNMTNCFEAIQTGFVTVAYTITFQNGETCKKIMELDCAANPPYNCCDSIQVKRTTGSNGVIGCCAELISKCKVDSIKVSVLNGTLSSASWNCGAIPTTGYAGQSVYTFTTNSCAADLVTCVNAKQNGVVTINYIIYLSNGQKCEKQIKIDCTNTAINQTGSTGDFEFLNLFPNPASGNFNVTYSVAKQRDVEIRVVNPIGQMVKIVQRTNETPGVHTVNVDARGLAYGLYKVVLYSDGQMLSKSAVLKE